MKETDLIIVVDTREQAPLSNLFTLPTIRNMIPCGDYSVVGLEEMVSIERKSMGDLIGSLTHDRERFEREFRRAHTYQYFAVVVEGSLSDVIRGKYRSAANPEAMFQSVMSWSVKYRRPWWFADDRETAALIVQSLLVKYARQFLQAADSLRRATNRTNRKGEVCQPTNFFA